MTDPLPEGLYEAARTTQLEAAVRAHLATYTAQYAAIPGPAVPATLARHVRTVIERKLGGITDRTEQLALVNDVLRRYGTEDDILVALDQLVEIRLNDGLKRSPRRRPLTPLSGLKLLTNAPTEFRIGQELSRELESADGVDLLCAFIRYAGIRTIKEQLQELARRGVPIRVLTTVYTGSTERKAIDMLVRDCNAQVKVSYDVSGTRLHAKAWLLKRDSGYDTGFIGSSNLTHTALHDGVEWNIRVSSVASPGVMSKFEATFDTYWNDPSFEAYDPDNDAQRFDAVTSRAATPVAPQLPAVDVRPYPHQVVALETIQAERELHDRHRNLVVAATGTGKTILAALDYQRLCDRADRPSLLFVAHRIEILEQARQTYRIVLADGSFGELLAGGERPHEWRHVFASVQSLAKIDLASLAPKSFEIVVIDEFHHAAATTYRRVLDHLEPSELLGLTATPERSDGFDVRDFFGGRTAYELRLWEAMDDGLLCPFHYYGIADVTDLRHARWSRGGYAPADLDRLYTGNDARARVVLNAIEEYVADPGRMRALGFCVSVAHAHYMSDVFNRSGIAAETITGELTREDRQDRLDRWRSGVIKIIFSVDVFNEGVDIPDLDTILMLRPTESAVVFQQQLGRGLRRSRNKAVLTVLDFIGQHRQEFRFADRFRALTGAVGPGLQRQIEDDFPYLPSGTRIILDRVSKAEVLENVRRSVRSRRSDLVQDLRGLGDVSLPTFLSESGRDSWDIYRRKGTWTDLRAGAGYVPTWSADEQPYADQLWRLNHVDDQVRLNAIRVFVQSNGPREVDLNEYHRRLALMMLSLTTPDWAQLPSIEAGLARLRSLPRITAEITAVCDVREANLSLVGEPISGLAEIPLRSHAHYLREEIMLAFDRFRLGKRNQHREGVLWSAEHKADLLLNTLDKDTAVFSPQTRYRDYPLSPTKFHWESQHTTSIESATGQRYLHHDERGSRVILFSRQVGKRDGVGTPFLCLGTAHYREHRGSRPIAIVWELDRPMPGEYFAASTVAR